VQGALLLLGFAALASGCPIYVSIGYWQDVSGGSTSGSGEASSKSAASGTTSTGSGTTGSGASSTASGTGSGTASTGTGGCGAAECMAMLPSGTPVWSKGYADPSIANPTGIAVDSEGNVVVAGTIAGPVDFGCGTLTAATAGIFVAKLNPCGGCLWSEYFDVAGGVNVGGVAVDASNSILLTGSFVESIAFGATTVTSGDSAGQLFIAKLDPQGMPSWATSDTGPDSFSAGSGVAVDDLGNVYVTGGFSGSMSVGGTTVTSAAASGGGDGFVMKLGAGGLVSWANAFGSSPDTDGQANGYGIALDASGDVLLIGFFSHTMNLGCAPLASQAGHGSSFDPFVAKLDPMSGACLWSTALPFQVAGHAEGIAVDPAGDVVVTGVFDGPDTIAFGSGTLAGSATSNLFVAKLGADGTAAWGKGFGSSGGTEGDGVAIDTMSRIFLTGRLSAGSVDFGGGPLTSTDSAFLLASFDAEGTYRWANVFEGHPTAGERGGIIAVDASSHVLVTGWADSAIDFGCGSLMGTGGDEAFVAAFMR
jgi:hypothetical protein